MEVNCFHCDQRIEEEVIQFDEKAFCCQGCKTVYEILNVNDLKDYWELFKDMEDPSKGRIYGSPPGWSVDRIMQEKFITYGLDEYFNYSLGKLDWRSLKFDTKILDEINFQGNAVVNYTGNEVKYTRVIEHKHFEFDTTTSKTVVTYEYPADYEEGMEKYYTVNDEKNNKLAEEYRKLATQEENVIFGGRLAEYKYYDMDDVIKSAMNVLNGGF